MFATGLVFWILMLMLLVVVVTFFERLSDLRRAQVDYQDFLKGVINVLDHGNPDEALSICEDVPSPVSQLVITAIRNRDAGANLLHNAIDSQGRAEIGKLERRLSVLAIIGQVAPLMGLFGALVGFVKTILVADSGKLVARVDLINGAMETLTVAIAGIMVAIIATIAYGSLRVRLDRIVVELEAAASQIVGYFDREAAK